MIEYLTTNLWLVWILVCLLCLLLELSSGDFFIMCFALGSLPAALAAACGMSLAGQLITFAVCSTLCLLFVRPKVLARMGKKKNRLSNADALMGRIGRVTQEIPAGEFGRVAIDGDDWKACSTVAFNIAKDEKVKVVGRDSIILTVEPYSGLETSEDNS